MRDDETTGRGPAEPARAGRRARPRARVLDDRALNRATLARQFLLDRTDAPAVDVIAHLCGLQAQEPQEPFVGLWSRVRGLRPSALEDLLLGREVVRTHLMRRTVHLMTADDALAWRTRHDAMLRQRVLATYREELAGLDPQEWARAGRAVMADGRPRTMAEIVDALAALRPVPARRPLGELIVAALVPMVQLPPRGLWRTKAGVRNLPLDTWLERPPDPLPPDEDDPVGQNLVRRYLAAFGPATSTDLRSWCGLSGLPAALRAVRDELVEFRDVRGRTLLDLPEAPRPDPETPAPVRFLPAFDNAILGYHHRARIIDDAHRGLSVAGERVVLVDGRVRATWTMADTVLSVTPLGPLTCSEREDLTREGRALASFLTDQDGDHVRIRG
ncbi:winged helix DNA-binding domain-containing protein [Nocardiopsis sp. MG754419]|uniref:winged helix DNA-binding domain-containing protein n=1 Tax=Nocardiopsis sp. MG754419 TaxID=2259865 RepID=UPI001BA6A203|nr:winged helix DNA-binding domain-containing protein [Nocardiopsis sp. MG754419]MBR8742093.1 winged helix DNA-binding domain-containing protein [Nocardiopsis sp. MG754419]